MYRKCCMLLVLMCVLLLAGSAYGAAPTYVAAGNVMQSTGAISVPWPTHVSGDVALLVVESANQTISLSTPAGFAEVTGSPQGTGTAGGTSATRLAVYWKRATTSAEANPTVADSGDHQIARIFTFRGVIASGNPWDVTAGNVASTASTSVSIPGATTTVADTRVAVIVSNVTDTTTAQTTNVANANLTSLAMCKDNNTSQGNGGGFGIWSGVKAAAGAYGTTTATLKTSSVQGRMSIALKSTGGSAPGAASNPSPANSATSVGVTTDLSWTAGSGATSHNVYFGTTSPGTSRGNQTATTYDTGTMPNNTVHYWRIDEVNAYGTTTGTVWSFTTVAAGGVTVVNPGFETPDISGYVYQPTGTSWSYTGGGFIFADSGSAFGNTAYAGGQNMVMQQVVAVYQTVSGFEVGHSYQVSWAEADRPDPYGGNTLRVLLGGTVVEALHTVTNDSWVVQTSDTFVATATAHELRFDATNTQGGDRSVFIDAVSIAEVSGSAPGAASNPSPANSATSVSITADLSWTAGSGATSHNVYFGTTSPGTSRGNQTATTYDTGTMPNGTVHYWRIDEVNAYGTTTGTVWSFTTVAGSLPGAASNPSPANSATSVGVTTDLSWTAGSGATSHNVYFGTTSPGTSRGNQTATTYDTGTMPYNTVHYWRIDEVNAYGTTTGTVWSFTTAASAALVISSVSPATYTVQYDSLAVGQLMYIDRTYTFTNVATLGGSTYIKTANADKSTTTVPWLTFNINQDCTVYCAHDDVITSKPSWMSTWTDTGANLVTNSPATFSLYSKVFTTGAVSIGGNAGGVSSSMYGVVVVPLAANPPSAATNPSPANSATGVALSANLSWTAGSGATSHNVYFGTDSTPDSGESKGNQTATTYEPGTLAVSTVYYWRIDEVNAYGTTTGSVWSFTTGTGGGLTISSNGHWIEYNGEASLLIGDSLTQGWMELGTNFPQTTYVDALSGRGINILMIWSYIGIVDQVADERIGYNAPEIWPWQQSSGIFDLNSFNSTYFSRLEDLVAYANDNDMAVLITIHDGWTKDRFSGHPFNTSKGGPLTSNSQYVELYDYNNEMGTTYNPSWTRQQKNQFYQERYVNSLINAVGDYPNVILEIFNEGEWYDQSDLRAHQVHFLNYIKARTDTLTMVNDDHVSGDNFRGVSNCDIISYHKPNWDSSTSAFTGFDYYDGEFWGSPAKPYYFGEPVPEYQGESTLHDALMRLMWGTAVAGAGFVVQNDASWGFDTNTNMAAEASDRDIVLNREGYCCTFFNGSVTNLGLMGPNGSLSSSGVCLAYAGTEYVAYSQSGSSFTVNLSAASGTLNCRFYNPRTGAFNSTFQRTGGSSAESFTKPDSNDWVLHILHQ